MRVKLRYLLLLLVISLSSAAPSFAMRGYSEEYTYYTNCGTLLGYEYYACYPSGDESGGTSSGWWYKHVVRENCNTGQMTSVWYDQCGQLPGPPTMNCTVRC